MQEVDNSRLHLFFAYYHSREHRIFIFLFVQQFWKTWCAVFGIESEFYKDVGLLV